MIIIVKEPKQCERIRLRVLGKVRYQGFELGCHFRQSGMHTLQAIAYLLMFRGECQSQGVSVDTCNAYCDAFVRGFID